MMIITTIKTMMTMTTTESMMTIKSMVTIKSMMTTMLNKSQYNHILTQSFQGRVEDQMQP